MKSRTFKTVADVVKVKAEATATDLRAELEGRETPLAGPIVRTGPNSALWAVEGVRRRLVAAEQGDTVWAAVDGRVYRFQRVGEDGPGGALAAENVVAAPMPGKVTVVHVSPGDAVEEGAALLVVEAMKMEHTLRAPMAGTVAEVRCAEGEQVEGNVPLVEIEADQE